MMQRRSLAVHTALLVLSSALALGCLRPPEGQAQAGGANTPAAPGAAQPAVDSGGFYDPTWADCSGKDGKGGVKLSVVSSDGKDKLPLVKSDFDRKKQGDESTARQPNWQLFFGPGDQSLAFEFTWVTKPDDKFWGNTWAGAGLAFNNSWAAVDASDARYLVLWAKTNSPGVDVAVGLQSLLKGKGKDGTGRLNLSEFAPGKRLDEKWRRIVIPLSAFPEIEQVDLKGTQQVVMNTVGGTYPENKKVTVYVDNVYFSNLEIVTPVSNPGYLVRGDGVLLQWDKDPGEKVKHFAISVNGKPALTADAKARSVFVPKAGFGPGQAVIGIATVGTKETSDEQKLKVDPKPAPARMDNEPGLWMHTHRDTVPRGISAEKLLDLNLQYAKAVKAADPTAKVIGFGAWGMLELAGSNEDYLPPGADGHKRQKENVKESDKWREKKRHGGDSQLVYLLKRFKQAEAEQGKRLIDVVDIHWYPELYGKTRLSASRRPSSCRAARARTGPTRCQRRSGFGCSKARARRKASV